MGELIKKRASSFQGRLQRRLRLQKPTWRPVLFASQKAEKPGSEKQPAVRYKFPSEKGPWLSVPTGHSKNNTQ